MVQISVNPPRPDPYKNFKFRIKWDVRYVAGVNEISALKRTTEVMEHRDGADRWVILNVPTSQRALAFIASVLSSLCPFQTAVRSRWRHGRAMPSDRTTVSP